MCNKGLRDLDCPWSIANKNHQHVFVSHMIIVCHAEQHKLALSRQARRSRGWADSAGDGKAAGSRGAKELDGTKCHGDG